MKKIIIVVLVLVLVGVAYWFISPLWRNKTVEEAIPVGATTQSENTTQDTSLQVQKIKEGSFTGFDRLHDGSGTATLIMVEGRYFIRFENDFSVTNGPDLYVGLGANGQYMKGSELAVLKGNKGSQNYELPAGMNPEDVKEVWIWCKAFSVPFAKAVLG